MVDIPLASLCSLLRSHLGTLFCIHRRAPSAELATWTSSCGFARGQRPFLFRRSWQRRRRMALRVCEKAIERCNKQEQNGAVYRERRGRTAKGNVGIKRFASDRGRSEYCTSNKISANLTASQRKSTYSASASFSARVRSFFLLASSFSFSASCVVGMPMMVWKVSARGCVQNAYGAPNSQYCGGSSTAVRRNPGQPSTRRRVTGWKRTRLLHAVATDRLQAFLACGRALVEVGGGGRLSSVVARVLHPGSLKVLSHRFDVNARGRRMYAVYLRRCTRHTVPQASCCAPPCCGRPP